MTAMDAERQGLFARVRDILIKPQETWARIAGETPGAELGAYVRPLAILGALAGLAGKLIYQGLTPLAAVAWNAISALLYIVFAIAGVMIAGVLIKFLARRFGAEPEPEREKQVAAYAATPIFVAALGALVPPAAPLLIIGAVVYAVVLSGMGVGALMPPKNPGRDTPRFTLAFAGAAGAAAALAVGFISPLLDDAREMLRNAIVGAQPATATSAVVVPRTPAERAVQRLAQSDGARALAAASRLEDQLPDLLPGGFRRQSASSEEGEHIRRADGVYRSGETTLSVTIIQFGEEADPSATADLINVNAAAADADQYRRAQTLDGRFFAERVGADRSRYVVIGRGVAMIAEGAVTIDQARAAVETIGVARLEAMFGR